MKIEDEAIMVTGGAGFIGSHLVDQLIDEMPRSIIVVDNLFLGREVNLVSAYSRIEDALIFYKQDASDFDAMKPLFEKHDVKAVFNLAVLPLPCSLEKPKFCSDVNMQIVSTLCELQRLGHFETLIQFSSSEAYGSARYKPMDEAHPLGPSTPYSASKAGGDLLALSYHRCFGTDVSVVRPFNNYGPRQNEGSYAGIIPITIRRILTGASPILYGDGMQTRDLVYVGETARMAVEVCKQNGKTRGAALNVCSGQEVAMIDLVKLIMKYMNYKGEIVFQPERAGDVKRHVGNPFLAEDILGFHYDMPFEKGLKLTVDWYLDKFGSGNL